jgi:hypothetical protein
MKHVAHTVAGVEVKFFLLSPQRLLNYWSDLSTFHFTIWFLNIFTALQSHHQRCLHPLRRERRRKVVQQGIRLRHEAESHARVGEA